MGATRLGDIFGSRTRRGKKHLKIFANFLQHILKTFLGGEKGFLILGSKNPMACPRSSPTRNKLKIFSKRFGDVWFFSKTFQKYLWRKTVDDIVMSCSFLFVCTAATVWVWMLCFCKTPPVVVGTLVHRHSRSRCRSIATVVFIFYYGCTGVGARITPYLHQKRLSIYV